MTFFTFPEQEKIQVTLNFSKPIPAGDLAKMILGIEKQYDTFKTRYPEQVSNPSSKLCVNRIEEGSIVIDFIEFSAQHVLPILAEGQTLITFGNFMINAYEKILSIIRDDEDTENIDQDSKELLGMMQTLSPVISDTQGSVTIINGDNNSITINNTEGNAISELIKEKRRDLKEPVSGDVQAECLFYFVQARDDEKSGGNRGRIDTVSNNDLAVRWNDADVKEQMLSTEDLFHKIFIVDVEIDTKFNEPALVKILKLHEIL